MPDWAQDFFGELLKPPKFLIDDAGAIVTPTPAPTPAPHRTPAVASQATVAGPLTQPNHRPARPSSQSNPASEPLADIDIEPARKWRAALVQAGIPESAIYAYGWDILAVSRHDAIVRVSTEDGDFALKRTHLSPQRVKFLAKALHYAREHGFNRTAQMVRAANGRDFIRLEDQTVYATRWLNGHEANFASVSQLGSVAEALAQWHQATRGFQPDGFKPDSEFNLLGMLRRRSDDLRSLLAESENQTHPDAFATTLMAMGATLRTDAKRSIQLLESAPVATFLKQDAKRPGLCHLDVIPSNFIYDTQQQMYLIDLDLSTYAPRALDLAHLLRRGLERANWNTEIAYTTFLHFHEVADIVPAEYTLVQALLTFPYRVWRLAHTRYRVLADSSQLDEIKLAAAEEPRRRAFLDSYARQIPDSAAGAD